MPTIAYDAIAEDGYRKFLEGFSLTNQRLRGYFDYCFHNAIDDVGCYPAWACIGCMGKSTTAEFGNTTAEFGNPPKRCPKCGSDRVFEIATFQSRAPAVGNVFEKAVMRLLVTKFELPAVLTPGNTRTHDIEITNRVAVETKGSPRQLLNPDKTITPFTRPGLERSDTWKKAQANARNFRMRNRDAPFFIVSNAVPPNLVGYRSDDITGIFDITKADRVNAFVDEVSAAMPA